MPKNKMTYKFTEAANDLTRIWVERFEPTPGTYNTLGQSIRIWPTGKVEVVERSIKEAS